MPAVRGSMGGLRPDFRLHWHSLALLLLLGRNCIHQLRKPLLILSFYPY